MMPILLRYLLAAALVVSGCSSPEAGKPTPADGGAVDQGVPDDLAVPDLGGRDRGEGVARDMSTPFDFGFDGEALDFVPGGLQPATVWWDGAERDAQFFLFNGRLGTLSFTVDNRTYTYRLEGTFHFSGEVLLGLTERTCSEGRAACTDDPVPSVLRENMVYDAIGRYDGEKVVFAPFTVRTTALELAPDFDFAPPSQVRMTPNDGFKPAQVPDARGNWVGQLTFVPADAALTGAQTCNVVIDQIDTEYVIESMACGDATFVLDGDPGPATASLDVDTLDWIVAFDFVDGAERYTLAGVIDVGVWAGVIVRADRYDQLGTPLDATAGDIEGVFYFEDRP